MTIPEKLAVMVLPGATLFPHSILPLFIFEPRYRAMLGDALASERMFCIAQLRPGADESGGNDSFYRTAGAGLIRACRGNEDGTSHLILQGAARVRISGFEEGKPYRLARVQAVETRIMNPAAVSLLRKELDEQCHRLVAANPSIKHIAQTLDALDDDATATDIVAGACVGDPALRQELLGEEALDRRLELLVSHLETLKPDDATSEPD